MSDAQQVIDFVHRECRLLDEWKINDWFDLFTVDGVYWIPMDETSDPRTSTSILYDDRQRLHARVDQAMRRRPAQRPQSRTVHLVTNIEVEVDEGDRATARCNFMCFELRAGDWRQRGLGDKQTFVGSIRYSLRREAGVWKMAEKCVVLLDRAQPIEGLSFFL